ncbi:phosphatidate phosphatase PAH1-like [Olea europaea var. sylvestris]|nr:phosphatidate phosphatase PAH1-like [Olea europaea var. sylvestris]XP_022859167.1 phosphatidate phosphatase PAH1-like [Olea europaea var. sylvestris]
MNVVGKVSTFITQGMYSVATPFHPFGGAVDIIVVQQQDGTFRSTPWYVRFGKFQGVLKGAEKVVRIEVNGIDANFHMCLDNSGEAYFVREVISDKDDNANSVLKDSDNCEGTNIDNKSEDNSFHIQETNDFDNGEVEVRDERITLGMDRLEKNESDSERVFYEFQDEQTSLEGSIELSEYDSKRYNLDSVEHVIESHTSNSEVVLVSVDGHILKAPISSLERNAENLQLSTPQFHLGPGEGTEEYHTNEVTWTADYLSDLDTSTRKVTSDNAREADNGSQASKDTMDTCEGGEENLSPVLESQSTANQRRDFYMGISSETTSNSFKRAEVFKSCLELQELAVKSMNAIQQDTCSSMQIHEFAEDLNEKSPLSPLTNDETEEGNLGKSTNQNGLPPSDSEYPSTISLTDLQVQGEIHEKNTLDRDQSGTDSKPVPLVSTEQKPENLMYANLVAEGMLSDPRAPASEDEFSKSEHLDPHSRDSSGDMKADFNTGIELSLCGNLLCAGMDLSAAAEAFERSCISAEEFKVSASSIVKNENLIVRMQGKYLTWDKAAPIILGLAAYGLDLPVEPDNAIPVEQETTEAKEVESGLTSTPSGRKWRLWPIPFRRVKKLEHISSNSSHEEVFVDSESVSESQHDEPTPALASESPRKQVIRTNVPTTDQIAYLNLKEGQNMVNFIFSTRVLGTQKVEAHIYLWKWNTRIVISDVDGTITKSDVLGQFMPLVGKDWTHSGIARLFSAIKENGYQLLFLSARAIVQAYLTKSFLFNLKQDGKSLPNGPVVISPDGLFPSLYREVVRRAPHEFKIACLEDIKALFPADYNPFYAGFGNRDTDELSYRRIGIPEGKIFIINPKGEVAINHRIDVKSYTSLHTLVHDMFPPTSLVEQEDYNSWNYWKMPLMDIENQ